MIMVLNFYQMNLPCSWSRIESSISGEPHITPSNGLAEWFGQTFKTAVASCSLIIIHCIQPSMRAPSTLLLGRRLQSFMDLLRPSVDKTIRLGRRKSNQIQCLVGEHVLAYDPRIRHGKKVRLWMELAQPLICVW